MPKYKITYAHEDASAEDESKRHGFATREIETDAPIDTQEQLTEVLRAIGSEEGYTKVGLVDLKLDTES